MSPEVPTRVLAVSEGAVFEACSSAPGVPLVLPFGPEPFSCLLWDHDGRATSEQRAVLVRTLLHAGCRYFVCGGQNCEAWHDAADDEFLARQAHEARAALDIEYVMTSWHEGEGVDEVAFFFVNCSDLHGHDFRRFLVLHVGEWADIAALEAAVRRQVPGAAT